MDNVDLTLITSKITKNVSNTKKSKAPTSSFKCVYQAIMNSAIKRQKEAENKKRYRLSMIIQKLLAGIILSSDELQFLKENAPVYYNQAIRQQMNYRAKNPGQRSVDEIEPINII